MFENVVDMMVQLGQHDLLRPRATSGEPVLSRFVFLSENVHLPALVMGCWLNDDHKKASSAIIASKTALSVRPRFGTLIPDRGGITVHHVYVVQHRHARNALYNTSSFVHPHDSSFLMTGPSSR